MITQSYRRCLTCNATNCDRKTHTRHAVEGGGPYVAPINLAPPPTTGQHRVTEQRRFVPPSQGKRAVGRPMLSVYDVTRYDTRGSFRFLRLATQEGDAHVRLVAKCEGGYCSGVERTFTANAWLMDRREDGAPNRNKSCMRCATNSYAAMRRAEKLALGIVTVRA